MSLLPEARAALHRRYLHDHLSNGILPEHARWLTEADIHAQAIAEVMREREEETDLTPTPAFKGPRRM